MLIVSCCNQGGGIFTIDEETFEITKIGSKEIRGIAVYDGKLFACNSQGLCVYDTKFFCIIEKQIAEDWHGLQVFQEKIFVVTPVRDSICVFNMDLVPVASRSILNLRQGSEGWNHINDLCFDGNSIYFSMFSQLARRDYTKGIGCIKKINNVGIEIIQEDLKEPHSPCLYGGSLYYCNSTLGEVRRGDEVIISINSYTRGLLVTDNYYYVGLSKLRGQEKGRCGVLRKSKKDGQEIFIPLDANEVYAITRRE